MRDDIVTEHENEAFPSFLSISATLEKRKKYKKIEIAGMVYIVEDVNTESEAIRPYELFPDILERFLRIEEDHLPEELRGKLHTINYNLDIKLQHKLADTIIKFTNDYGLLGLAVGDRSRKYLKHDIKPDTEYKSDMTGAVFVAPFAEWHVKHTVDILGASLKKPSRKTLEAGLKPMIIKDNVLTDYHESVVSFMYELDNIYRHRKNVERFKNPEKSGKKLTEDDPFTTEFDEPVRPKTKWKEYFEGVMNEYTGHNLYSMTLEYDHGSFKLRHDCKTLLSALILMNFQDVVNQHQKIRFCENPKCGRVYIANSKKQRFHDQSCGTYVRVNRLRGRDIGGPNS